MGSICKRISVQTGAAEVWEAMRDYGAVHERVAPGFVVASQLEGCDRLITFASGAVARERLVCLDDERRRLAYTVVEGRLPFVHHQASVEVSDGQDRARCVITWITDFLPEELGGPLEGLMTEGAAAIARVFS